MTTGGDALPVLLVRAREERGLTAEKAAQKVDVTLRQWQRWEAGESNPRKANRQKLNEVFAIGFDNGAPDDSAEVAADRLAVIEAQLETAIGKLDELLTRLPEKGAQTQAIQEAFEDLASRIGQQIGKRPPRSKRGAGPAPEDPPAAASGSGR